MRSIPYQKITERIIYKIKLPTCSSLNHQLARRMIDITPATTSAPRKYNSTLEGSLDSRNVHKSLVLSFIIPEIHFQAGTKCMAIIPYCFKIDIFCTQQYFL